MGRTTRWQAELSRARDRLAAATSPSALVSTLAREAAALIDAQVTVALLDRDGTLRRCADAALDGPLSEALRIPGAGTSASTASPGRAVVMEGTACGVAVTARVVVMVSDSRSELDGTGQPSGHCCPGASSQLAVPLHSRAGPVLGVLTAVSALPGWFADTDRCTAVELATVGAQRLAELAGAESRVRDPGPPTGGGRVTTTDDRAPAVLLGPGTGHSASPEPGAHRPAVRVPSAAGSSSSAPAPPIASTSDGPPSAITLPSATASPTGTVAVAGATVRIPEARAAAGAAPTLGLGLWEWDRASNRVTLSPQVQDLVRRCGVESVGLDAVRGLLHPGDRQPFEEALRRLLDTGVGADGTARLVLHDGSTRQVYVWADARRSRDVVTGAWGALVDVTQRERDAATLRTSLLGLRAAQELTGLGTWEWNPADDHLSWSPEMFRLAGLEPGEIRPTLAHWHEFVHPEDVERARRLDVLALERDGGVETFRVVGADRVLRHVQSWSCVVTGEGGTPRLVCGATVDVTRQITDRVTMARLSATDAVTGLGNRHAFDARMTELLAGSGRDVALLLLDLDRFKLVNDSLGHQVGDRLLVEVARRLASVVPPGATTARMGGDEFVVVPEPGLGWLQVRRLAQAIVDALRMPYVLPDSAEVLVCPASVGVTTSAGRRASADVLLSEADLALYRAKDSGRDRYVVFDDDLRSRARSRHRAERLLRRALEFGGLTLQYQPIVDFVDGRVAGAEALVRVRDGGRDELIPPDAFIEVAEDTGLIVELDCWVIDTAVAEAARWAARSDRHPLPWLAVNVSARSMEHPRVVRRLLDGIQRSGLTPDRIKVELTEHSFLGTLPGGEASLQQLLASGIPVGIDDFGTGYSAMAYLQRFDLDFMKIDRSFVADVGQDDRADAVVTAIVDLAHAHEMTVTAEGIETPRQARRLREIGCDLAQGYHFGRPGDVARILRG